uniref:D-alanine-D-alanine ligase n=1 Tax=Candidatus Kentrum sp. TUN TaxID=2126343 RepID=A0A450ZT60_9GAMM|nr:MAG: D-alanine-D-alanine ligase [Candidatus Kentron sp. TUN]
MITRNYQMNPKLLKAQEPSNTRILYMAPYAPDFPDFGIKPYDGDGTYPNYHFNIYKALKDIGYSVHSTSKPYAAFFSKGEVDFVFSLMNRMPFLNAEIFISSMCEFLKVPYLGAPPNIRALAEDKSLSKLAAKALDIPVPPGVVVRPKHLPGSAPFPGPYFIKDRFGSASKRITDESFCASWDIAQRRLRERVQQGRDLLLEQFAAGIDVTIPVIGNTEPFILGAVHSCSDRPRSILTEDLKVDDHLGYQVFDLGNLREPIYADVRKLCAAIGPVDYFRIDFRVEPDTAHWAFLELNICSHIGRSGAICLAAAEHGLTQGDLLEHIVEYSLLRQLRMREHYKWIL